MILHLQIHFLNRIFLNFDMIETAYGETNLESDKNTLHVKYDNTITR